MAVACGCVTPPPAGRVRLAHMPKRVRPASPAFWTRGGADARRSRAIRRDQHASPVPLPSSTTGPPSGRLPRARVNLPKKAATSGGERYFTRVTSPEEFKRGLERTWEANQGQRWNKSERLNA